jgi:hypothetical protein
MSLQLGIPGGVLSSRARFRFPSRSYNASHQSRPTMLQQQTAKCSLPGCLSPRVHSKEMTFFNQLKKDAGSVKGTLVELETELKQGKLTQSNYNALRHCSLRLAEETSYRMDAFLDQQAQRYVVAHPEQFFTKDKIAYIRTHPQEFPEFTEMKPEEEP